MFICFLPALAIWKQLAIGTIGYCIHIDIDTYMVQLAQWLECMVCHQGGWGSNPGNSGMNAGGNFLIFKIDRKCARTQHSEQLAIASPGFFPDLHHPLLQPTI